MARQYTDEQIDQMAQMAAKDPQYLQNLLTPSQTQPRQQGGFNMGGALVGLSRGLAGQPLETKSLTEPNFYQKELFKQTLKGTQATQPKITKVGNKVLSVDPDTGDVEELYTGPEKEKSAWELESEARLKDRERTNKIAAEATLARAEDTMKSIQTVKNGIKYFGAKAYSPIKYIAGTAHHDWRAELDKLLSTKIVNLMNEMKNASKTGATGFGPLNREELQVLRDASTALKETVSPQKALTILNDMEEKVLKIQQGAGTDDVDPEAIAEAKKRGLM